MCVDTVIILPFRSSKYVGVPTNISQQRCCVRVRADALPLVIQFCAYLFHYPYHEENASSNGSPAKQILKPSAEILGSLYLLASEDLLGSKMTEAGVMWRPLRQQVSEQGLRTLKASSLPKEDFCAL
jgi:hypothetical protein